MSSVLRPVSRTDGLAVQTASLRWTCVRPGPTRLLHRVQRPASGDGCVDLFHLNQQRSASIMEGIVKVATVMEVGVEIVVVVVVVVAVVVVAVVVVV